MKRFAQNLLVVFLASILVLSPRIVQMALAQDDTDAAPVEEVQTLQNLAQKGYLGDKKDFYLSAKGLTEDDITDALLKIKDQLALVDFKTLQPGDKNYQVEDLKALLTLIKDKSDDILARKVSAWKFQRRVEKMIAALSPVSANGTPVATAASTPQPTETPSPVPTATPVPGPTHEEWNQMKDDMKDLVKKTSDLQDAYDKKIQTLEKNDDDVMKDDSELKTTDVDLQEQLKLVKKILDQVQDNLNKTGDRLDQVSQKASEKAITDTELEQELTILHKDLRDNSQDVTILKEEVAKLDKTNAEAGQSPLDQFLNSKWLAGGALAVGLTALVVSLTRK
jgi:hypothetical protein